MSTYHDYLQTLDRATGFAPPLEWLQAKPDPRTAPHLLENECRLYRTYQFNGALLIGNRRETATASYDLLSMARLEAGMNSLSSLFSESDTTCLSTTQRLMVMNKGYRYQLSTTTYLFCMAWTLFIAATVQPLTITTLSLLIYLLTFQLVTATLDHTLSLLIITTLFLSFVSFY